MSQPLAQADPSNSPIVATYRERTATSENLAQRAGGALPSGIVHDARRMWPYAIYVERASGARKWDVDGNEYVDYYGGHGALILGHGDARVRAAVADQLERSVSFGAPTEIEIVWPTRTRSVSSSVKLKIASIGSRARNAADRDGGGLVRRSLRSARAGSRPYSAASLRRP